MISDAYVARAVKAWADPALTVASAHVVNDHLFVVFRNPDGCVVFDQTSGLWHERQSYESSTWRVRHIVECFDMTLGCSATTGTIYRIDAEAYDEDGDPLVMEAVTPYAYAGNARLTVSDVEVVAQLGVGSLTLDAQISLEKTVNGRTWGEVRRRRLGKVGRDEGVVRFGPQGQGRAMAFRIRITDAVQRAILGVYADIDVEAA